MSDVGLWEMWDGEIRIGKLGNSAWCAMALVFEICACLFFFFFFFGCCSMHL